MAKKKTLHAKKSAWGIKIILLIFILFSLLPLYYVIINAFKEKLFIQTSPMSLPITTFTLENVSRAFRSLHYLESFRNSLINVVLSCAMMIVIGSLAGYAIAIVRSKPLRVFYIVAVLVITIPFQVVMIPQIMLLRDLNLLNNFFGTSLVYTALSLPLTIFLYTGFMRGIPRELCEAAVMDGCGFFTTYLRIYMPLVKTVTGTVLILRGTYVWNDLLVSKITLTSGTTTTLASRLYSFASGQYNSWDLMFGATLLCALPIIVLFLALQKFFVEGVVAGAVKG